MMHDGCTMKRQTDNQTEYDDCNFLFGAIQSRVGEAAFPLSLCILGWKRRSFDWSVGRLPLYSPLFHERERHHFDRKRSRADGKGAIIRNNLPQSPTRQAVHLSFPISESPSATSMIDSSKISPKIYCLPSCAFITIGCRRSVTVAMRWGARSRGNSTLY